MKYKEEVYEKLSDVKINDYVVAYVGPEKLYGKVSNIRDLEKETVMLYSEVEAIALEPIIHFKQLRKLTEHKPREYWVVDGKPCPYISTEESYESFLVREVLD